jgi:hypothetical protein
MQRLATKGGKKRQVEATNCDKFVAAFCRILLLGFEPRFFLPNLVGDGVSSQIAQNEGKTNARYSL